MSSEFLYENNNSNSDNDFFFDFCVSWTTSEVKEQGFQMQSFMDHNKINKIRCHEKNMIFHIQENK